MESSPENQNQISRSVVGKRQARAECRKDFGLDEHLGKLLTGSLDISGFRQWFASALWEIESEADEDTIEFASLIENRIAEYARGHVSDSVLLGTLRADVAARTGTTSPG